MREARHLASHGRPMRLEPRMVIGAYQVVAPIGAGGMGEVYRARDLRLRRDVALKVVSARWHDAAQLARFQREARVLASLSHPHIASIYGLEECTDVTGERTPVIVLELVEGPTLLERIARGPVPLDEAIAIALQIAEALEAAHEHGIVHRDLKPANVKITRDGSVKVLDFGLAKAIDEDAAMTDPGRAPTQITSPTRIGEIVGTPAYMAPEQARGAPGDRRDDIWAFGAVLFEMLTGVRAFQEPRDSDGLATALTSSPDWNRLPSGTPPRVRRLIGRCLERDVRLRLQAIGEARIALSAPHADDTATDAPGAGRRWFVPLLAVGAIAIVVAAAVSLRPPARTEVREARKLDLVVDGLEADLEVPPVVSPDGRRVVYRARGRLWVRSVTDFSERPLPASEDATYAFWAPDSRQVAFVRNRHVWRVSLDGSGAVRVGAAPSGMTGSGGAVWASTGQIVLSGSDVVGLYALPLDGGPGRELLPLRRPDESDFHELSALPDGRGFVFTAHRSAGTDAIVALVDGVRRTVLQMPGETLRSPVYSPSGHLLFQRASPAPGIWAISFALDTLQTSGPPFLVVPGGSWPSTAVDGTLVLVRQSEQPAQLVWLNRAGAISPIAELEGTRNICTGFCAGMAMSPDRQRVAMALRDGVMVNLWTYDLGRAAMTRLLTGTFITNPTWSADGRRLFVSGFFGDRIGNLHHVPSTRAGTPERLLPKVDQIQWPCDVSPDGAWLVYAQGQVGQTDLWAAPLSGSAAPRVLIGTPFREVDAKFSPDGRWLAYTSDESGRFEVYVRSFASVEEPMQISTSGASMPAWSPDGRELFFRSPDAMMVVTLSHTGGGLQPGPPRRLFALDNASLAGSFGVSTDAKRFLFIESGDDRLSVVLNWAADAERLVRGQQ